jgi:hypothetical protein
LEQLEPAMRSACRLCISASDRGRDHLKTAADESKRAREIRNDTSGKLSDSLNDSLATLNDISRDEALRKLEDDVKKLIDEVKQQHKATVRAQWEGGIGDFGSIQQFWDQQDQLATAQQQVAKLRRERK